MGRSRRATRVSDRTVRSRWEEAFEVWEDFQESGKDFSKDRVHAPGLLRAIGPVAGMRVLDLGCGQGRFTRMLARRGAKVSGLDWSERMISSAQRHEAEAPQGIDYRRGDARKADSLWAAGSFDLVVGSMSFMDMPGLPRVLRAAHRVLRPQGRLVFSTSHPFNTSEAEETSGRGSAGEGPRIERYFDEGPIRTRWQMARLTRPFETFGWHRTFESWFRLLHRAGFQVLDITEPRASPRDLRRYPLLRRTQDFPFFLVLDCRAAPVPP